MSKTLVLIRHAHRDTSQRENDNGLDDKGREQAKALRRFFTSRHAVDDKAVWLVSSPKKRCLETLEPISRALDRPVDVHPLLDEGGPLDGKVRSFLEEWKKSKVPLTLVCSHGDWLPVAIYQLFGLHLDVKKGCWLEAEIDGGGLSLKWYVPSFKHFYS